jgi:putative transposase
MRIKPEVIDELLKDYKKPEDVLGENGLLKQLTKALLERALNAEMTHHLGYEKHERVAEKGDNARNGVSEKTLDTEQGELVVQVPRDRKLDI